MVSSTLHRTIAELSRNERVESCDFIDITLGEPAPSLTPEQKSTIRQRAAQMEEDPTFGIPWEEVRAELMTELQ